MIASQSAARLAQMQTVLKCMPKNIEDRKLPLLPYTPTVAPDFVELPVKHAKANVDMLGPERIHNQLIFKQFGIIALGGGALTGAHYDVLRDRINKFIDFERFFAVWRIDPPWKAVSKKSLGKKMGGGKAKVHHYETPIRAGRILLEIAGIGHYNELDRVLSPLCRKMPLYCMPITQEIMDELKREKLRKDAENYNPFEFRYLVRNNFSNSKVYLPHRDSLWGGTYF